MIYLLAIILGLIQALTEFLPISSSAHLILARGILDFDFVDGLTFDVGLHVGTLAAVVVYFHKDIRMLIGGMFSTFVRPDIKNNPAQALAWMMVVSCVPAALVGVFFEDVIEIYFRNPMVIVATLILGGALFLLVERVCKAAGTMEDMTFGRAIIIGLAQALVLIPGVSRSGITISIGMAQGIRREEAARFSFLMAAPLLAGAGAKKAIDLSSQQLASGEMAVLMLGVITSAVAGWVVIRFLLNFLRTHGLGVFAWYRFALAAIVGGYLVWAA